MRTPIALLTAAVLVSAGVVAAMRIRAGRSSPTVRTFYIAADETVWDYAPSGRNLTTSQEFNEIEKRLMVAGPLVIGRKARKAIYREYTDSSFSTPKERPAEWEHLGMLGPLVRGVVGDTIRVVFRNNASFPASVHPHGVFYDKDSEGAPYDDGTSGADKADDGVPTGGTHVYTWVVPERAGPSEMEGSSILWMYHSHVDETRDVASGLIGPMIITRDGMADADGAPRDVDREIVAGFIEVDENHSWYVERNVREFATQPDSVEIGPFGIGGGMVAGEKADDYFRETINGYSFGHTPGMTMRVGQKVRWYVMASTNFEFHSPHWHGNVVVANHMRTDVGTLLPMGMFVADMAPDNPGRWFLHCHVSDHLRMGMQAFFTVEPATTVAN